MWIDPTRITRYVRPDMYDYALHDAITGKQTEIAQRKRWWMRRLAGPNGRYYARLLMGLPTVTEDKTDGSY